MIWCITAFLATAQYSRTLATCVICLQWFKYLFTSVCSISIGLHVSYAAYAYLLIYRMTLRVYPPSNSQVAMDICR